MEHRKFTKLDEVTVTTSKVMFYHKGDTLIYNADAFVLAEGSMLDALLDQMPGVEFRSNGEIYCQGRKVDNLLLNGRDIFNGKRELMLENLGAYTVKDIAVYDKRGRTGELMGRSVGDEVHVMDVRLKRHYLSGWIANAEGGYGTRDRYLGKLFGMWYSEDLSFNAYASSNNLSDSHTPGKTDEAWSRERMSGGVHENHKGGLNYTARSHFDKWELKGGAEVAGKKAISESRQSTENYMEADNIYSYSWSNWRMRDFHVSTDHEFFMKLGERANMTFTPRFSYNDMDNTSEALSATFREKMKDLSRETLLAIYSGDESIRESIINRMISEGSDRSDGYNASASLSVPIKVSTGYYSRLLSLEASISQDGKKGDGFERYLVNFGSQTDIGDRLHHHTLTDPDTKGIQSIGATFTHFFSTSGGGRISGGYKIDHSHARHRISRFNLNSEGSQNNDPETHLDRLPPGYDADESFLPDLSYSYRQNNLRHHVNAFLGPCFIQLNNTGRVMVLGGQMDMQFLHRNFKYLTGESERKIARTYFLPNASAYFQIFGYNPSAWRYDINLGLMPEEIPDMTYLVDTPSGSPLQYFKGNPDLKDALRYNVSFAARHTNASQQTHRLAAEGSYFHNAIENLYDIDDHTGVWTYRPRNVKGNYAANTTYEFFSYLGKRRMFYLNSKFQAVLTRRTGDLEDHILTCSGQEDIKLNWQNGRCRVAALGNVQYADYRHSFNHENDFHSWTYRYGAEATLNLPGNWSISTDITAYNRRGFTDPRLNSTDVVWNARIAKSMAGGALVVVVDGYDMLGQLSNISYSVNAQARTETVTNYIPSYFLCHLQWRFNRKPKGR